MINEEIQKLSKVMLLITAITLYVSCGDEVVKTKPDKRKPKIISGPIISSVGLDSTNIVWKTDKPCSTSIIYFQQGSNDTSRKTNFELKDRYFF